MSMSDWASEKLDRIKDFGQAVTSGFTTEEKSKGRYDICKECEYYGIKTSGNKLLIEKGCNVCKCYLPAKVLFRDSKCPKGYWPENLLENVERVGKGLSGEGEYKD